MSTLDLAARITESYELCSQWGQISYNYQLDTYKISVALLSYPKGILYSLTILMYHTHCDVHNWLMPTTEYPRQRMWKFYQQNTVK